MHSWFPGGGGGADRFRQLRRFLPCTCGYYGTCHRQLKKHPISATIVTSAMLPQRRSVR